ncbi:MAG: hypothetical protein KAI47_09165 [Deltaproteobacteria bacterium]|nr:hypothetical protein [Deltaproteobacteria bacterium]
MLPACGYHLAAQSVLPGGARSVRILAPDVTATDRPRLAATITSALAQALGRRGIAVVHRSSAPRLRIIVLHLALDDIAVVDRRTGGERWRLALEARLSRDSQTLWRSGLLTVRASAPISARVGLSEASRSRVFRDLVEKATRRVTTGLLAGGTKRRP